MNILKSILYEKLCEVEIHIIKRRERGRRENDDDEKISANHERWDELIREIKALLSARLWCIRFF